VGPPTGARKSPDDVSGLKVTAIYGTQDAEAEPTAYRQISLNGSGLIAEYRTVFVILLDAYAGGANLSAGLPWQVKSRLEIPSDRAPAQCSVTRSATHSSSVIG